MKIIGRQKEIEILKQLENNNQSDLLAIYGRRRIGKTFLIREFYRDKIVFSITGIYDGNMKDQLAIFHKELQNYSKGKCELPNSWLSAFTQLEQYLNSLTGSTKKVLFIDELPWLATSRSSFLKQFEHFWNTYCTNRKDLLVILCGSAASFMIKNIIKNKGGLHNRISQKIRLLPFDLKETKAFLESKHIKYTQYDILQLYMAMGGVPHYLNQIKKGVSVAQNIDSLFFDKEGTLHGEFNLLYSSLFQDSDKHISIIKALNKKNGGLTRKEILEISHLKSGGDFTQKLDELIESGFVTELPYYQNKKQLTIYRLADEYSRFYLKFIEENTSNTSGAWVRLSKSQSYLSWSGFAFEMICIKHIEEIKKALGISGVFSSYRTWFNKNAQIDLMIDRDDNIINICEIKFYNGTFTLNKKGYLELKNKLVEFQKETKTKKSLHLILISTYGIHQNSYSDELIQSSITMEQLF